MNLFPFERCSIISPFTPDTVEARLEEKIEEPEYGFRKIFAKPSDAYFTGKVINGTFKILPVISGRNSFIPLIKGSITPYLNGSLIHVRLKMHMMVIVFCIAMFGFIIVAETTGINRSARSTQPAGLDFIPIGAMLCFMAFGIWEFKSQCSKAKNKLLEITDGEIHKLLNNIKASQ